MYTKTKQHLKKGPWQVNTCNHLGINRYHNGSSRLESNKTCSDRFLLSFLLSFPSSSFNSKNPHRNSFSAHNFLIYITNLPKNTHWPHSSVPQLSHVCWTSAGKKKVGNRFFAKYSKPVALSLLHKYHRFEKYTNQLRIWLKLGSIRRNYPNKVTV